MAWITKYKVMCNVYFEAQDGLDYMAHEADGEEYTNKEKALEVLHSFQDDPRMAGYEFYIESEDWEV